VERNYYLGNLWESKKILSRFSFLAKFELTGLLRFFSNHLFHNKKKLYHIMLDILIIMRKNNDAC